MAPLEQLRIADPDTYDWVRGRVSTLTPLPTGATLDRLVTETIWALSQEPGLGRAMADGLLCLIAADAERQIPLFIERVHQAAQKGPTLARLLATHLVAILIGGPTLLARFDATVTIMLAKGTYTLNEPLNVLSELLANHEQAATDFYLELLAATFAQPISYNHSVRLVYLLPKAVREWAPHRRPFQIPALIRVVRADLQWVDLFLEGMQKGLAMLGAAELNAFIDTALEKRDHCREAGAAFISLSSQEAQKACARLQIAVPLSDLKGALSRYLTARLGRAIAIRPMSDLSSANDDTRCWICSDGRAIYLSDEIDHYATQAENRLLGKLLVRLEAGYFEHGTFTLDLERAADQYPQVARRIAGQSGATAYESCKALHLFRCFAHADLAEDLFMLFEHARLVRCMAYRYPGLAQQALPILRTEADARQMHKTWDHPLAPLYGRLVLHMPHSAHHGPLPIAAAVRLFENCVTVASRVEVSAHCLCSAYSLLAAHLKPSGHGYHRLLPPFGRRLRWDLVRTAFAQQAATASRIKLTLAEHGVKVYQADLQKTLSEHNGHLSVEDIRTLVLSRTPSSAAGGAIILNADAMAALFKEAGLEAPQAGDNDRPGVYYPEWDEQLRDYLRDHARVQESTVPAESGDDFYRETVRRHHGLVARMRHAFAFLKPEGLLILRQWPEGDAFDYRALIDYAIDKRAGRIPSDRLFIKRLKQERDVAALLLVDLSRSTANPVAGGEDTVLTVAKQALVLFCEALQVVGDTYAIAGFSGTGRHSVDYFRIKDFDEPLSAAVRMKISALRPQRSTRMGAAIRHAAAQLETVPTRVRLLIVVSDGFPNDIGYKADYAIADTRHAAQEARTRNVHVKAITVNIGSDPRLDDLYGRVHHHVIAEVRELPDKLLRLYGTLTRRM
jgi:hypothetical protein